MFFLAIGGLGMTEIIWILVVVLLLFGARKLPELARAMGTSITQFKKGLKEDGERSPDKLSERASGDDRRND